MKSKRKIMWWRMKEGKNVVVGKRMLEPYNEEEGRNGKEDSERKEEEGDYNSLDENEM